METLSAALSRGTIHVEIDRSSLPATDMFSFAERINPKRSFLFVSKVLGRHIPVRPSLVQETYDSLAKAIDPDLPGPVLCIGMAETAVGLGAGVHDAWRHANRREDAVYLCSTRHNLGTEKLCEFSEDHSHATQHILHMPRDEDVRELCLSAKSLILIDDEASTGNTFLNLYSALPEAIRRQVERIVLVTLTDWSDGAAERVLPGVVESVNLSSGRFRWEPLVLAPAAPVVPAGNRTERPEFKPDPRLDWGRLGYVSTARSLPMPDARLLNGRVLVLGTGEYVWQPYLLAKALESRGHDVRHSSLTRSPISVGHAITDKAMFADNYGMGVANYAYNIGKGDYDTIILCVETPMDYVSDGLFKTLKTASRNVLIVSTVDGTAVLVHEKEFA